ncbi:unnamed protein product [Enterobius vermicularis]|uniref:Lipid-binding serum glycoprotein C-terminal domain-containing protein n=1 Tax=Enterobius vermicularis TaxID=51028 RepID=A0A3P6IVT6_ENTVE|nr:unnamed protein product [Enterobius vermicularis]
MTAIVSQSTFETFADDNFAESGNNAGFVTRINRNGLDLLAEYLKERVKKISENTEIPVNFTTTLDKDVTLELISSNLVSYDASTLQSRLILTPQKGLTWIGSQLAAKVSSVFKVKDGEAELIGRSNTSVEGAVIQLEFSTDINSDGHLKTDMSSCKLRARQISINFSRYDVSILSNYFAPVLCSKFYSELMPSVSNRLMNTPMSAILFEHYFINYGFTDKINYTEKFIETRHRGNTFAILRQGANRFNDFRLPFHSTPMHLPNETYGMIDFYVSNYTMSSLLYWMDQYRKFDYEISKDSVGTESLVGYLRTSCGVEDVCAGTLFPALASRFPGGMVQIKTFTSKSPTLVFDGAKGVAAIESLVEAYVQQTDKTTRFLTAKMTVDVSLTKFAFKDYELTTVMKIEKFKIFDIVSTVDGIDAQSLEFLVSALNELVIADDLAKKLKGGIKLPIMLDFPQKSADVVVEKDALRISVNFCYEQNCDSIAENKDDIDYYDAVKS